MHVGTLADRLGVARVIVPPGAGVRSCFGFLASPLAFEVESEADVDVRRELARAVVTRGWGLLELRPVRMSLEEVFLSLTTEERPVEEAHA